MELSYMRPWNIINRQLSNILTKYVLIYKFWYVIDITLMVTLKKEMCNNWIPHFKDWHGKKVYYALYKKVIL